ncbi:S9 family peptidase [Qipengyuania sediminis]|uniref:S9 family peptidase n=1 Tax=Qipengyuania sediminis TaxID=1532023 RepID=UPI001059ECDB|nr:S9 family peptidase [Qipengyuania sediminis]
MPDAIIRPPQAARKPHSYTHHGVTIEDPYHWLRDPGYPQVTDPEILAHLQAENAWFEHRMAPQAALVETLFQEMKGRIKEADRSVPQKDGDWVYWIQFEEGAQYKTWWRRPVAGGDHELILDEPGLSAGHAYFRLGALSVSPSGRLLAYSTDTDGSERYMIRFRDLSTGEVLADTVEDSIGAIVWSAAEDAVLYSLSDENWRHRTIKLHRLGTPSTDDAVIYHDPDEAFSCSVSLGAQERWIILAAGDHETSEVRLIPAADPLAEPILVRPRAKGVEYAVDVRDDTLFVHTNDTHENFRLATAPFSAPGEWTTLIEGSDAFYLTGVDLFRDFYVIEGRRGGLDQIELRYYNDPARVEPIAFPEASYSAGLGDNPEWAMERLRLSYESMVSPATVYDYHIAERRLEALKVQEIPSGYNSSLYRTERIEIAARDGTMVPVSVMMRRDREPGGPLYLYGYGAYGIAIDPGFGTARLSLVDRGFAYAVAHIRGGDDLGRAWYKAGKLDQRTNAFNDFVDVAHGLIERGYTAEGRIAIAGGSAGGELMGAAINQAPELFGAVAAHVPFVDVLNTMLDASLPLTPGEWPEWGNPIEDRAAFDLIRSYSPYDQVRAQAYPPLLVTAGLNDPRVTYWEPAKWVAKLRECRTNEAELLFKINMGAGHGGKSGRFDSLREVAEEYAFILWQMGMAE